MKNVIERAKENDTEHKVAMFRVKQQQGYNFKKRYAAIRAWEFYNHPDIAGNCYVAVGGEAVFLLLPVLYCLAAAVVRDMKDRR